MADKKALWTQARAFFQRYRTGVIVAAGLLGMALILLSSLLPEREAARAETAGADQITSTQQYKEQLETDLRTLVENTAGAGSCEVIVTLASGVEYVYAGSGRESVSVLSDMSGDTESRQQQENEAEESLIIVRSADGGESPVLLKELLPEINGVVVLCEGADSAHVVSQITEAVTTVLHIPSTHVCVIKKN